MKILYVTSSVPTPEFKLYGTFIYNRIKELSKLGIKVSVAKYNSVIKPNFRIGLLPNYNFQDLGYNINIEVNVLNGFIIPTKNIFWGTTKKLENIFNNGEFDIIHAHFLWDTYPVYLINKRTGIPYIVTVHGSDIHTLPYKNTRIRNTVLNILENASMVLFVSKYLLSQSRAIGFSGKNISIIPNGFDDKIFNISKPSNITRSDKNTIGFIGSLIPTKGADRVPYIFKSIHEKCPNTQFILVGEGYLRKEITKKLMDLNILDKVKYSGWISQQELSKHINDMDVIITPSRKEGWGCIVIEAQACGVPVVGSDAGGLPESIGNGGVIVHEGNNFIDRFTDAVIEMIDNPPKKELLINRSKEYTWEKTVKEELLVYQKTKAKCLQ